MPKSKKIKIVSGDGKDINISDIKEHLDIEKPEKKVEKEKIIIPNNKK